MAILDTDGLAQLRYGNNIILRYLFPLLIASFVSEHPQVYSFYRVCCCYSSWSSITRPIGADSNPFWPATNPLVASSRPLLCLPLTKTGTHANRRLRRMVCRLFLLRLVACFNCSNNDNASEGKPTTAIIITKIKTYATDVCVRCDHNSNDRWLLLWTGLLSSYYIAPIRTLCKCTESVCLVVVVFAFAFVDSPRLARDSSDLNLYLNLYLTDSQMSTSLWLDLQLNLYL